MKRKKRNKSPDRYACPICGGVDFDEWELVPYRNYVEGIMLVDGRPEPEYGMCGGQFGDGGEVEGYACKTCHDAFDLQLDELIAPGEIIPGKRTKAPRLGDAEALDKMNRCLSAPNWSASFLEDLCEILRSTGREKIEGASWDSH